MFEKIKKCEYTFDEEIWKDFSKESKDFIVRIIVPDPKQRMTIEQALDHPWLQSEGLSKKANEKRQVNLQKLASKRSAFKANSKGLIQ